MTIVSGSAGFCIELVRVPRLSLPAAVVETTMLVQSNALATVDESPNRSGYAVATDNRKTTVCTVQNIGRGGLVALFLGRV